MSRPISLDQVLDPSGGTDDEVTESVQINSGAGVLHVENQSDEGSTSVDFHLEARLSDSLGWQNWMKPYADVPNGNGRIDPIDLRGVTRIRVRAVNQDGSNQAAVAAEFETQ